MKIPVFNKEQQERFDKLNIKTKKYILLRSKGVFENEAMELAGYKGTDSRFLNDKYGDLIDTLSGVAQEKERMKNEQ